MHTKQKVLYLITKSTWGGAQQYVFDLAKYINPNEFDTVVAVGGDGPLVDALNKEGLRVIQLSKLQRNVSLFNDIQSSIAVARMILKERPDVLHVNSSKAGALGTFFGRLLGVKKVIFTSHGWAFNEDRPAWQKTLIKVIQWFTVLCSHTTIVVSNGTKAQMNWPLIQKKMRVVHLGRTIDTLKQKEDARGIIEMKVIDNVTSLSDFHDDIWIGSIAELHPIKRLNRAIDAMAALTRKYPNVRYVIIHDGQLKEQLQQQVKDLGLDAHVFFTGMVEHAARLLPAFDIFVLPSKSEAFPYVLVEAGMASLPVIASDVGGVSDIIIDQETGILIQPDNTPMLTNALAKLIEDTQLRNEYAHALYEKSSTFTLEKMIATTEEIYTH